MLQVQILEEDDTIKPDDWCRPLALVSMSGGYSDGYSFTDMYSGQPENNVKWIRVKEIFGPMWIGKTVDQIGVLSIKYEFIRGEIPKSHQYGKTNRELRKEYELYLAKNKPKGGKYAGKHTWEYISKKDPDYFAWAMRNNYVNRPPEFHN